ncbi:unnamed protein product [Durusdinium trenchii]|uniref:Uncharacterized protein n=1 Tax=Durusdinium trenchii TaxID=1381693 RepID=A0ABP0H632_9DINO
MKDLQLFFACAKEVGTRSFPWSSDLVSRRFQRTAATSLDSEIKAERMCLQMINHCQKLSLAVDWGLIEFRAPFKNRWNGRVACERAACICVSFSQRTERAHAAHRGFIQQTSRTGVSHQSYCLSPSQRH